MKKEYNKRQLVLKKILVSIVLVLVVATNGFCRSVTNIAPKTQKTAIKVAMLLPLYYENIDELSFNEYNIDEKRGKKYKCFSYLPFYEGARLALDELEKQGYKVSLYVFDCGDNDDKKMQTALNHSAMKDMDLVVALVMKQSFNMVSEFCRINKIPLINPLSQDDGILNNPYVIKIQPDDMARTVSLVKYIEQKRTDEKIVVLYDDRDTPQDILAYWKEYLPKVSTKWTIINYRKNASRLSNYLSDKENNFVINLINKKTQADNKAHAKALINTLSNKKCKITLFASYDWFDYVGNDYKVLQELNLHFFLTYYNDFTNVNFTNFANKYRTHFKVVPDKIYASIGYDIINYFLPLISSKGKDFIHSPNTTEQKDMIVRYKFAKPDDNLGWANTNAIIYRLEDYKVKSCWCY